MLELLDAYPGQRFRVIRLLLWAARWERLEQVLEAWRAEGVAP